jgi:hypothetical protein
VAGVPLFSVRYGESLLSAALIFHRSDVALPAPVALPICSTLTELIETRAALAHQASCVD